MKNFLWALGKRTDELTAALLKLKSDDFEHSINSGVEELDQTINLLMIAIAAHATRVKENYLTGIRIEQHERYRMQEQRNKYDRCFLFPRVIIEDGSIRIVWFRHYEAKGKLKSATPFVSEHVKKTSKYAYRKSAFSPCPDWVWPHIEIAEKIFRQLRIQIEALQTIKSALRSFIRLNKAHRQERVFIDGANLADIKAYKTKAPLFTDFYSTQGDI